MALRSFANLMCRRALGRVPTLPLLAALATPLVIGVLVYQDYGVAWDEYIQRALGRQAWRYVFDGRPAYLVGADRFYGVAWELTLYGIERAFALSSDTRPVFLMRHLANFVLYWLACVGVFDLVRRRLGSVTIGLVAFAMMFSSPRLFADAFYNTKDLAFLSWFALGLWTLDRFLERPTMWRGVLHGLVCAFATDVRLSGLLLPVLTLPAFAIGEAARGRAERLPRLAALALFTATVAFAIVAFWPFLWHEPVRGFAESLRHMAHYPWRGEMLFAGEIRMSDALPWSYAPHWMAITVPLGILPLFLAGTVIAARGLLPGSGVPAATRSLYLVALVSFFGPLLLIIGLRSVLYDGWRQLYFLHVPLVLLATLGASTAWRTLASSGTRWRRGVAAAALVWMVVSAVSAVAWMVRWHPYQNLYFNAAAGDSERVSRRFELDYWGLSCRRVMEQVLAAEPKPSIAVLTPTDACWQNLRVFEAAERERFVRVHDRRKADYVVQHYRNLIARPVIEDLTHTVVVDGLLVASAQRLRAEEGPAMGPGPPNTTAAASQRAVAGDRTRAR